MAAQKRHQLSERIIESAMDAGASLAGIADLRTLRRSPSHKTAVGNQWPPDARSALVIALEHRADEPGLDWWDGDHGTPGNRKLIRIANRLEQALAQTHGILAQLMPYHDPHNELFHKDAAVLAGLGSIGRNNLLITPVYGPRVRLRVLFLTVNALPSGPIDFNPCSGCPAPCLRACPRDAFQSGSYERSRCQLQMRQDEIAGGSRHDPHVQLNRENCVHYCRACELACPVPLSAPIRSS